MSAAETMVVGRRLPRIRSVTFRSGFEVSVSWTSATRGGATEIVDLHPLVFRLKFYAPLREDEVLRRSVHVFEQGAGIAWGERDEIDMAAGSLLRLVEEAEVARSPTEQDPVSPRTDDRTAAA